MTKENIKLSPCNRPGHHHGSIGNSHGAIGNLPAIAIGKH